MNLWEAETHYLKSEVGFYCYFSNWENYCRARDDIKRKIGDKGFFWCDDTNMQICVSAAFKNLLKPFVSNPALIDV